MEACPSAAVSVINSVQTLNCVVTVPASVTATLVNLLVLIAMRSRPSLHLPANFFIASLALSDFGVGLFVQPVFFVYNWTKLRRLDAFCAVATIHSVIGYFFCGVSLLTLTAIALDKYAAVSLHLRYQEVVTAKRVIWGLVFTWLSCALASSSFLWSKTLLDACASVTTFLSFGITTFTYCKIYLVIRRHQFQIQGQLQAAQQRENFTQIAQRGKSAWNALLVHCLFLASFVPYAVASIVHMSSPNAEKMAALELGTLWVQINSSLTPFFYLWRFRQIRAAVVDLVRSYFANPQ